MFSVTVKDESGVVVMKALSRSLTPQRIDAIVADEAARTFAEVVRATPKKWFGQVRASWQIATPGPGVRVVFNDNKIMGWLEHGTQAHGPVKAKALFIPLTKKAVLAYTGNKGFTAEDPNWTDGAGGKKLGVQTTNRKGKAKTVMLEFGKDYVLAKRVKGIEPMHIAEKQAEKTETRLRKKLVAEIDAIVKAAT